MIPIGPVAKEALILNLETIHSAGDKSLKNIFKDYRKYVFLT